MLKLGCIADDFTGATDLGSMLVRGGMRTVQCLGVPEVLPTVDEIDAVVVSLKTRSVAPENAVKQSLAALKKLQQAGCRRFLFKYCSTFDSTDTGNIGPVAEALMAELHVDQTIFCPAFPENKRTVVHGHLFVGGDLLNESGMQHHPVNPMHDASLVRVLQRQASSRVGLVDYSRVSAGLDAILDKLEKLKFDGVRLVVADALTDDHLAFWAQAVVDSPLVTGGSAIAKHLADVLLKQNDEHIAQAELPTVQGRAAILAGSCSQATQRQVNYCRGKYPIFEIQPEKLVGQMEAVVNEALELASSCLDDGPVLITSTAPAESIQKARLEIGEQVSDLVESAMAQIASGLVELGVRRLVVAGGETSGAVLQSIGVTGLRIGPEIDLGVPWTQSLDEPKMALALKSGNFGGDDFFVRALGMLP